jgi:uncharacterized protein with HEPN domain
MPSKNPAQRLADILENIEAVCEFTEGMQANDLPGDRKTLYAIVRALEIISEAVRRLPVGIRERHPEIDWTAVAAAGNIYRHEYESVDESLVWHTVQYDLGGLRAMAQAELNRLHRSEPE